MHKFVWKTVIV